MKIFKYGIIILIMGLLCACGTETMVEDGYRVYYLNNKQTKIEYYTIDIDAELVTEKLNILIVELSTVPSKLEYTVPLGNLYLMDMTYYEGCLTLNFTSSYYELSSTTEVLVRAAIVRTLSQLEEIEYINILIEGTPLIDNSGNLVGMISEKNFIDYAENEKSEFAETEIILYFADSTGQELMEVSRIVDNNGNQALEKLIVEELIQGTKEMGGYPTINPNVKILNISVQDGVCYVNLDSMFLTQVYNVSSDVTIYSIVNSLVELSYINQVQILIDGKTDIKYREKIDLNTIFEKNYNIID